MTDSTTRALVPIIARAVQSIAHDTPPTLPQRLAGTAAVAADVAAAYWPQVQRGPGAVCWPWLGSLTATGRGIFRLRVAGKEHSFLAHRVAYELTHGAYASAWPIKPTCQNPLCCNPAHLVAEPPADSIWTTIRALSAGFWADVEEFCAGSLQYGASPKTVSTYKGILRVLTAWLADNAPEVKTISELTRVHIRLFDRYLIAGRPESAIRIGVRTRAKYLNCIRSLLKYVALETDVPVLPRDRVRLPKQGDYTPRAVAGPDEVRRLLATCDLKTPKGRRDAAILTLLISAGLRIGELVALDHTTLPLHRFGTDDALTISVTGKGGHARAVFLCADAQVTIARMLADRHDGAVALFVNFRPGWQDGKAQPERRITARGVQLMFRERLARAGLPSSLTPHSCRHGFAIDLLERGVDIRYVQELLGHRQITTTQVYTRLSNPALRAAYLKGVSPLIGLSNAVDTEAAS